jgi:hypothetical protein
MSTIATTAVQRECLLKTRCMRRGYAFDCHRISRLQKGGNARRLVWTPAPVVQSDVITAPPARISSRNARRCVFVVPLIFVVILNPP